MPMLAHLFSVGLWVSFDEVLELGEVGGQLVATVTFARLHEEQLVWYTVYYMYVSTCRITPKGMKGENMTLVVT